MDLYTLFVNILLWQKHLLFSILHFLDEVSRQRMVWIGNKNIVDRLTTHQSFQWRLERLEEEHGIYFHGSRSAGEEDGSGHHAGTGNSSSNMRELFRQQYRLRHMWNDPRPTPTTTPNNNSNNSTSTKISVRFKPLLQQQEYNPLLPVKKSALPLSQRLTLLRLNYNLSSNQEALKLLAAKGGIGCFHQEQEENEDQPQLVISSSSSSYSSEASAEDDTKQSTSPTTASTTTMMTTGIHTIDTSNNRVIVVDKTTGLKEYSFDAVLNCANSNNNNNNNNSTTPTTIPEPSSVVAISQQQQQQQEATYQKIGHPAVRDVLNGSSSTIICYGQTGSGKTYTMMGGGSLIPLPKRGNNNNNDITTTTTTDAGLLPRACHEIFRAIQQRRQLRNIRSTVSISYVEIYGNEVTDLLRGGQPVSYNRAVGHRTVLDGHSSRDVDSLQQLVELVAQGNQVKKVAATSMNERSSRAHSIFMLHLQQQTTTTATRESGGDTMITKESKLVLADLGGAEHLKKSQAATTTTTQTDDDDTSKEYWKERTREAIQINLGLLALKYCVHALNKGSAFVPFAHSRLTQLLSAGLAQPNSKTNIVVCASRDPQHATETIASLQFAQACRGIQHTTSGSGNGSSRSTDQLLRELVRDLDDQIEQCRSAIRQQEEWVTEQLQRSDGNGGVEFYTVSRLTGAEQHNQELERLLRRRNELTGGTPWDTQEE